MVQTEHTNTTNIPPSNTICSWGDMVALDIIKQKIREKPGFFKI